MKKEVIVIPTYNEKENISVLIPLIFKILPEVDVVVADDNSPDGTGQIVQDLKLKYPRVSLISRPSKSGLGRAYIDSFKEILKDQNVSSVVMMDADLSHDPKYLVDMLKKSKDYSVVVGSRYTIGGGTIGWEMWRRVLSFCGNLYCRFITGIPIKDCTGGFNVISANLLRKIDFSKMDMSGYAFIMELKYLLYKAGGTFFEVPITFVNRRSGETKISSHIISEGVIAPLKLKFSDGIKFDSLKMTFLFLGFTFFVGIWHAFPMLNVIGDEMYYVGGALRAMENHTIIPAPDDVPYGTLTYLLNYVLSTVTIVILLPFFEFSLSSLKLFLVESPWIMYLSLRFLSALLSLVFLFYVNKIIKKQFSDIKVRVFLLLLIFTNIITTLILHTGKMWVLSELLVIISFYYLYNAISIKDSFEKGKIHKNILLSIIVSFLALSNFPLNFYCLINIPILFFYFRGDKELMWRIVKYTMYGFLVYIGVTLFNFESIKNQIISIFTGYRQPTEAGVGSLLDILKSTIVYLRKTLYIFPLLIVTFVLVVRSKIKDKNLLVLSSVYFLTYFSLLCVVVNWSLEIELSLRNLFPLGFFLLFIISSFNIQYRKVFGVISFVGVTYYIFTLYYLSVPTTYNDSYNWIKDNLASEDVTIVNNMNELQLIKNKKSYLLNREGFCVTKCQNVIKFDLNNDFKPLVYDKDSSEFNINNIKGVVYHISTSTTPLEGFTLVKEFTNPSVKNHGVDYNLGSYFDKDFFKLKNLGEDIYIYRN